MNRFPEDSLGSFTVSYSGNFEVGGFASFEIVYTVGQFGMDDRGSIRVASHGVKDISLPQFVDPTGIGYTTAECSAGAQVALNWLPYGNERPWMNALDVSIEGRLKPGDSITVRMGDTSQGSPGFGIQTTCQDRFKFKILVNPFSTQRFIALPDQPYVTIGPAAPHTWKAVLPTLRTVGEGFALRFKCEDFWGNPSDKADATLTLRANHPVIGLPTTAKISTGEYAITVADLSVERPSDVVIDLLDESGAVVAQTNPLRIVDKVPYNHYWGDLHGQSEETIGTNTAWRYFEFARDKSFLDVCGHQGNDFQITDSFWQELNEITKEFDEPGRFVAVPGYEWSGNTAVGGDRNVWYRNEGETIHRSHRALIDDPLDDTDAYTARELFEAIKDDDVVVAAHVGGRWPDIFYAHDGRTESAVEIHSAWGTFEWILHDGFEANYRIGVVANSDDHKGRPGASYPGRIIFPTYGGLTCFLASNLDRDGIFESLRRRHHYATTGNRLYLNIEAYTRQAMRVFKRDPAVFGEAVECYESEKAIMGDIAQVSAQSESADVIINVRGSAPIERVDLFDGIQLLETILPYQSGTDSHRIRVSWSGARYRGRGRNQNWKGEVTLTDNEVVSIAPIGFWNPELLPKMENSNAVSFTGITGGTRQGIDLILKKAGEGKVAINTNIGSAEFEIASLGDVEQFVNVGGMDLALHVQRLPQTMKNEAVDIQRTVPLADSGDTRIYVRITQEDGHKAWSSPIYLFKD